MPKLDRVAVMPSVSGLPEIVARSLIVSFAGVTLAASVGIPLGVLLGLTQRTGRRLLLALAQTGMAMPPVVVGLVVYLLLSRGGPLGELGWLFTSRAMILAQSILALPFLVAVVAQSINALPAGLDSQIRTLGATPWQMRCTLIREARSGIVLAVAAAFGRAVSEVGAVLIVGGNIQGHTRVLTTSIILETSQGNFGLAIVLGAVLLTIALAINMLMVFWIGRDFQ